VKAARTVWSGGKGGKRRRRAVQTLPIAIRREVTGNEAVNGEVVVLKRKEKHNPGGRRRSVRLFCVVSETLLLFYYSVYKNYQKIYYNGQ